MVAELSVRGAEKFGYLAKALRQAGDKELQKELYKGINRAVKPLTADVKASIPQYLPRRYAFELAKSLRVRARRRAGRDPSVRLVGQAKTPRGKERDLRSLERGRLRHPLYGNRGFWYDQKVSPDFWNDPLLKGVDDVRTELVNVLDDIAKKLEKKL